MSDKPDFEALRAKRNADMRKIIDEMGAKLGAPAGEARHSFDFDVCYCNCPDGLCEHSWDGPTYESEDGCMMSATCSRCGAVAAYHDMRVGP